MCYADDVIVVVHCGSLMEPAMRWRHWSLFNLFLMSWCC